MKGPGEGRGTWSYDGSLDGLFVLAHRAWATAAAPAAVANALAAEGELFGLLGPAPLEQAEPSSKEEIVAAASELRAFSGELFDLVAGIWMGEEGLEMPLFRLCAEAGRRGDEVLGDYGNPDLRLLRRSSRRVNHEVERLKGLARFAPRPDGLFASPLEPDANVVPALVPHFARRFGDEDFAIVDILREIAVARRGGRFSTAAGEEALAFLPEPRADEETGLWRRYFRATENPARRNPELQRRLMPLRYWKYLPEMGGGA